jgi:transposase-like protein
MTLGRTNQRKRSRPATAATEAKVRRSAEATEEQVPDPEVLDRPVRRTFTGKYKLSVLREAEACTGQGEVGALLRREGLYSSHLTTWRQARERGELAGLAPRKRGAKTKQRLVSAKEYERVKRENLRLERELEKARVIIDVQKKLSAMLGIELSSPENEK